jgi:hypothetical protein
MENIIIAIIESGALGIFFFFLIKGLHKNINSLNETIIIQNKTLDVMDKRIQETEKVGMIYKKLIEDLPYDLENYKTIINKTKDQMIIELTNQKEIVENKLQIAEKFIRNSGDTEQLISKHLNILKILLGKHNINDEYERDFELLGICEYDNRKIDESIKILVNSLTLDEFFKNMGFEITISVANDNLIEKIFDSKITPKGEPLMNMMMVQSHSLSNEFNSNIIKEWFVLCNDELYITEKKLSYLKDEFSILKQ